jgi:hypothetical protein
MLAHLNAALDDWQAQALGRLRPMSQLANEPMSQRRQAATAVAVPKETANRWAQLLANELRKAVGESAWAVDRRLSGAGAKRGVVANDVGAAIRSAPTPYDKRPTSNVPRAVRTLEQRPAVRASTSQRARAQVDEAKPRRVLDRQKQPPRPPLSLSQQMAQLYRGTVAGDGYTRAVEHDAWAMVPDNLKAALEDYWRGTPLTRHQVQRLIPVYRRYVAKTSYSGDMVQWITATLRDQRYPHRRAEEADKARTRNAASSV